MNKEEKEALKQEFGIHFKNSPDEFGFLEVFIDNLREEEFKRGYNQRLKEEGKVGEKYQGLYL